MAPASVQPRHRNGIVTARGASDNKDRFSPYPRLEQALKEKGDLPVNLILLIEGEEEIGSPNLEPFLEGIVTGWPAMSWPFPIRR